MGLEIANPKRAVGESRRAALRDIETSRTATPAPDAPFIHHHHHHLSIDGGESRRSILATDRHPQRTPSLDAIPFTGTLPIADITRPSAPLRLSRGPDVINPRGIPLVEHKHLEENTVFSMQPSYNPAGSHPTIYRIRVKAPPAVPPRLPPTRRLHTRIVDSAAL